MKRLFTMILLLCSLAGIAHAQRITRNFQNVSMSDALKYIQQQTGRRLHCYHPCQEQTCS